MPIKSKAEWRYLASEHPELFREFQAETGMPYGALPERVTTPPKTSRRKKRRR